jgi:hypothetical protein
VIVQPDSSTSPDNTPLGASSPVEGGPLSAGELYQLTLYKWRYSLEAYGFEPHEVRELMFLKWLHASKRVLP